LIRSFGWVSASGIVAATGSSLYAEGGNPFLLQQVHETIRTQPTAGSAARWFDLARPCIGMDVMPGIQGMFGTRDAARTAEPFSLWRDRPSPIQSPLATGAFPDPLFFVVNPVRNVLTAARDEAGIRTDLYEALLWQAASDALPDQRSTAGAARFNARVDALLFRVEGEGMGRVTMQFRDNEIWPNATQTMERDVGSISNLDEIASSHPTCLPRLYYAQSFFDDRALVMAGKVSMNDVIMNNIFSSDETRQYLSQPFVGNDVWPVSFQDHSLGVSFASLPASWLFVNASVIDAGGTQDPWIDANFGNGYAIASEVGLLAELSGLPTRVSFAWCGTNANEDTAKGIATPGLWGNAYGLVAQSLVLSGIGVWSQWTWADEDVASSAQNEVALGITLDDCFGRHGDGFGTAIAWSQPADSTLEDQVLLESYYRMQVTGSVQVSLDTQILMPSANSGVDDPTVIGSLRVVWRF
jgi:hypothetical protein